VQGCHRVATKCQAFHDFLKPTGGKKARTNREQNLIENEARSVAPPRANCKRP